MSIQTEIRVVSCVYQIMRVNFELNTNRSYSEYLAYSRIGITDWIFELPDEKNVDSEIHEMLEGKIFPLDKVLDMTLYLMRAQLFYDEIKELLYLLEIN